MVINTGSIKRACAPIYFRFSSLLGLHPMKNSFNVKYLENGDRYDVGVNRSRTGSQVSHGLLIGTMTFDLG